MQEKNINSAGKVLKYYLKAYRKYKRLFLLNLSLMIILTIFGFLPPYFYKHIIDIITNVTDVQMAVSQSLQVLGYVAILYLVQFVLWRIFEYVVLLLEYPTMEDCYKESFDYLNFHSYKFFSDNFVGSLVRKVTKFVNAAEVLMDMVLIETMSIFFGIIFIVGTTLYTNLYLGLFFIVWLGVYIFIQYNAYRIALKYDLKANEQDSKVVGYLSDSITNNFNITTFSSQKREKAGFVKEVNFGYKLRMTAFRKKALAWITNGIMFGGLEIFMYFFSIKLWANGLITIGTFFLLQTLIANFMVRISGIANIFKRFFRSISDASEMIEILETPHDIQDIADAKDLIVSNGKIAFEDVGFYYKSGKNVLQNLDIQINAGEKVALVGVSGSGKTTISRLLMRLYDIQNGKIVIDGQDISKVTQTSLRSQISLVPQEPILFHRTIAQNIAYGKPDATMEEIIQAAKLARADEFISRLENGYESLVGERGIKLSGGEKQRVAIARALLQNNKILILDEATSSLDSESEMYIQQAIEEALKNKTAIVIAHRLSTIMKMDRIIVMQHGKIVEMGKHQELLDKKDGVYQKLWNIQSGGFLPE